MKKPLIAIAPMMDWTDRHYRVFMRCISKKVELYTEMVTTQALIHGDVDRHLAFDPIEHPLTLQLGGSDPKELAHCSQLAQKYGYDALNLNVGCPSDRVQKGKIGACLMKEAPLVGECLASMRESVTLPVSVKTRIGVDNMDSYAEFRDFIATVASYGVSTFIIHARKAWLKGLNPKQNREIPPLNYEWVKQLKQEMPNLTLILNGGLTNVLEAYQDHLDLDGIMLGRAAYQDPYQFATVDSLIYGEPTPVPTRNAILLAYLPYVEQQLQKGVRLQQMTRHLLGLAQSCPGARNWRRYLTEESRGVNELGILWKAAELIS